jgi:EF-hand domain
MIKDHFMLGRRELKAKELRPLCTKLLNIPIYFAELIIPKIGKDTFLDQATFMQFYKFQIYHKEPQRRCFYLIDKGDKDFLTAEDFAPLIKSILDLHPGLEFLKATPEF